MALLTKMSRRLNACDTTAFLFDQILDKVGVTVFVEIAYDHISTFLGEVNRDQSAETAVAAGDEGQQTVEFVRATIIRTHGDGRRLYLRLVSGLRILGLSGEITAVCLAGHIHRYTPC